MCGLCYTNSMESGSHHDDTRLPAITETDWLELVFEDVVDPEHRQRWERLASDNPVFARELAAYAYHEAHGSPGAIKASIDTALWAMETIRNALGKQGQSQPEVTSGVGDGDVDRRP